jgi:hypothetical protein
MIFKNFRQKNRRKECRFCLKTLLNSGKKMDHKEKRHFCRKLVKIAENCDYNIDPRSRNILALRTCLAFNFRSGFSVGKMVEIAYPTLN